MQIVLHVAMARDVPDTDADELLGILGEVFEVHEQSGLDIGPEWLSFIGIMKDVGATAGAVTALAKLGSAIIKWRSKRHVNTTQVIITINDERPLDLRHTTDEEIESAFQREASTTE